MIKLIASDLDGTLLKNGAQILTERAVGLIGRLGRMGIVFTAASGRQYPNLKRLFGRLSDEMAFICENGAYVVLRGQDIFISCIERELGLSLMRDIYRTEGCEILLSGKNTSYLQAKSEDYVYRMQHIVKNNVTVVEDISKVKEPFLKISIYQPRGLGEQAEQIRAAYKNDLQCAVSGREWMDFTAFGVNKGKGLSMIQERLSVSPKETMVFGDNYNDIEMLAQAYYSYVMKEAVSDIKVHGRFETEFVEDILEGLLKT